ncbi:unnamed protein product [Camellia sinensis]
MDGMDPTTRKSSKSVFTPLLISMLGIACTSLALILYHFIVRYITSQRRQQQQQTTSTPPHILPGGQWTSGVDPNVLNKIPILFYSAQNYDLFCSDNDCQNECAVCLGELEEGEMVRLLPNCKHAFHVTCVDQWFVGHASCPLCRAPIVAPRVVDGEEDDDSNEVIRAPFGDGVNGVVGDDGEGVNGSTISVSHSCGLLRHCASMEVPVERFEPGLKRSLSMDQSFVVVDIQRKSERACSSSSSSTSSSSEIDVTRTTTYVDRSMKHLDRVSSKFFGSFSRRNPNLLPY